MKSSVRLRRHFVLLCSSLLLIYCFAYLSPANADTIHQLSFASAYASLILLILSLSLGPWWTIRKTTYPVSSYLRRDIGIWAGMLAIVHTILGLQVHLRGKFWEYFIYPATADNTVNIRFDAFGMANHSGLIATLLILLLIQLSNNYMVRKLGLQRWKMLQRCNYMVLFLIVVHGALYQILERRSTVMIAVFLVLIIIVVVLQFIGFKQRRTS